MSGEHLTLEQKMARYIEDENGCWIWTGPVDGKGYGLVYDGHRVTRAHRLSYLFHVGDLPPKTQVHHDCENRRCINPEHLRAVTALEHRHLHLGDREHCKRGHRKVFRGGHFRCYVCERETRLDPVRGRRARRAVKTA